MVISKIAPIGSLTESKRSKYEISDVWAHCCCRDRSNVRFLSHASWRRSNSPGRADAFAPFEASSDYFPPDKQWMLNFRVANLDMTVQQLRAANVVVEVDPELKAQSS